MPRFFLIDNWLANAKGHNFQYALDVAGAAQGSGYDPVLAVRQSLSKEIRFPANWHIERVFEFGESPRHWIGLDGRNPHPCNLSGDWLPNSNISWWQWILDIAAKTNRARQILSFSQACDRLFNSVGPTDEDILLFPSLSEFDFLCAARFWRDHPWTKEFDWHLQFHFNFFLGRDPEFGQQPDAMHRFQRQFRAAVDEIPEHRLHFYATTEAVARQYDALGIAIFHPLPYPVRPLCDVKQPIAHSVTRYPLRVTFPGGIRHEKGKKQIRWLINSLWEEFLETNQVQLTFQAPAKALQHRLPKRLQRTVQVRTSGAGEEPSPVMAAPHPLDAENYARFIRESDIGLLAYDARRYFARASGVLCEMLSAGVPVIVPAGCWLADQIAEENYRHVDSLWRQLHGKAWKGTLDLSSVSAEQLSQLFPAARDNCSPLARRVGFQCGTLQPGDEPAHTLLVRFDWPQEATAGTYIELVVQAEANSVGNPQRRILGCRHEGPIATIVRLENIQAPMHFAIGNAFDSRPLSIPQIEILRLPAAIPIPPLARVGLIASEENEIPALLREMTRYYEHYRHTARQFANLWQYSHSPDRTISILESRMPRDSLADGDGLSPWNPLFKREPKASA